MMEQIHCVSKVYRRLQTKGVIGAVKSLKKFASRSIVGRNTILPYTTHFEIRTRINHWSNQIKFKAPPHPYKTIYINIENVKYNLDSVDPKRGLSQIISGELSTHKELEPVCENRVVLGLHERFIENKDWEDTVYYRQKKDRIKKTGSSEGYSSPEEYLEKRCIYVDELYESIKNEGYQMNSKIGHSVPETDSRNNLWRSWSDLEPLIAIGRCGEIYLVDGRHRFAIAKIIGLDTIPVNVIARHEHWQKVRDKYYSLSRPHEDYIPLDHPDLQDLQ